MKSKLLIYTLLFAVCPVVRSQGEMGLEEFRARALRGNNGLKMAEERQRESAAMEKVALWQMLPKLSANGMYMWMDKSVNLLSEEQKRRLAEMGTTVQGDINAFVRQEMSQLPVGGEVLGERLTTILTGLPVADGLNNLGQELVRALETDTRNVAAGMVTVTQPLFMGGKLHALYRTASLLNSLSRVEYDKKREETLIGVDEAYWQVVSVQHKKELAEQYVALLQRLNDDVEEMVAAEVATKGDLAKVRVKLNEGQMSLTKATGGLALAKMLLAQRCGMPLDTVFEVRSEVGGESAEAGGERVETAAVDMDSVYANRAEMKMLRISDSVARQGMRLARATLLPNIAVTGGYLVTNPNVFNGFDNSFNGTLMAGVAVNIPLLHPGSFYSVKAAKHKRREVAYQMAEAEEMIALQVKKLGHELEVARKKLAEAESNLGHAEENLRLADESFKAGLVSSSDLMAAQTAWLQAKGDVLDARIEIEMGRVYLNQATGSQVPDCKE